MFAWQSHLGRYGGDGRCLQVHDILKLSLKRLALSSAGPGGVAIPSNQLQIEPRHMRSDDSRPGDLSRVVGGLHAKDVAIDIMVTLSLRKSTLLHASKSSDYAPRLVENKKFTNGLRNTELLQLSATKRLIPLVQNQCGRCGPHFEATLREFASLLIKRSTGCCLL